MYLLLVLVCLSLVLFVDGAVLTATAPTGVVLTATVLTGAVLTVAVRSVVTGICADTGCGGVLTGFGFDAPGACSSILWNCGPLGGPDGSGGGLVTCGLVDGCTDGGIPGSVATGTTGITGITALCGILDLGCLACFGGGGNPGIYVGLTGDMPGLVCVVGGLVSPLFIPGYIGGGGCLGLPGCSCGAACACTSGSGGSGGVVENCCSFWTGAGSCATICAGCCAEILVMDILLVTVLVLVVVTVSRTYCLLVLGLLLLLLVVLFLVVESVFLLFLSPFYPTALSLLFLSSFFVHLSLSGLLIFFLALHTLLLIFVLPWPISLHVSLLSLFALVFVFVLYLVFCILLDLVLVLLCLVLALPRLGNSILVTVSLWTYVVLVSGCLVVGLHSKIVQIVVIFCDVVFVVVVLLYVCLIT